MLSQKARDWLKDVLRIVLVFAAMSGAYYGLVVAERYRALTQAYLVQAEALIQILNQQAQAAQALDAGE